jgi:hypothetical protein
MPFIKNKKLKQTKKLSFYPTTTRHLNIQLLITPLTSNTSTKKSPNLKFGRVAICFYRTATPVTICFPFATTLTERIAIADGHNLACSFSSKSTPQAISNL